MRSGVSFLPVSVLDILSLTACVLTALLPPTPVFLPLFQGFLPFAAVDILALVS